MTVVVGAPCAGKSTLVNRQMKPGDVVVDFDSIAREMGSQAEHDHPAHLIPQVKARRAELVRGYLDHPPEGTVWVILTYISQARELGIPGSTRLVVVDPGTEVCLARARAARRSPSVLRTIVDWTAQGPREFPFHRKARRW